MNLGPQDQPITHATLPEQEFLSKIFFFFLAWKGRRIFWAVPSSYISSHSIGYASRRFAGPALVCSDLLFFFNYSFFFIIYSDLLKKWSVLKSHTI